jgi:uncharacterized membrane protein YhaH (DUF805 family)
MKGYLTVLRKYAVFSGRARRSEYWSFSLINSVILISLFAYTPEWVFHAYNFAVLLPFFGVSVRRLHDADHSAWWLLIGLTPFFGGLVLLIFFLQDSSPGSNRYGPNPKDVAAEQDAASESLPPAAEF